MTDNPAAPLHIFDAPIRDGENNEAIYDIAYSVSGNQLPDTLSAIEDKHGPRYYLMPISAASAGGGIFQHPAPGDGDIVALNIRATPAPRIHGDDLRDIRDIDLDEIIITPESNEIIAGAAITLEQLNAALGQQVSSRARVMGADLTSYTYAQVGSTFMTGGMGPQRRYFSDSVSEVALHNGVELETIAGDDLAGYAGTYGWSGIVTAVKCRYHTLPANEVAFALPVDNDSSSLAALLQHLSSRCFLKFEQGRVVTADAGTDLIVGLEHITVASMGPLLAAGQDPESTQRARQLIKKCEAAGSDGIIFVSGYSDNSSDEFLAGLVDDISSDSLTIAGIDLEHTEVFNNPDQMRKLREAVPFAARNQQPTGRYQYKNHSDATIRLNPDDIELSMRQLWDINVEYVDAVNRLFAGTAGLHGEILVYGHLNPYGVDPHNRVTLASDDLILFEKTLGQLQSFRDHFYRRLKTLCDETGSQFIGGEKSADSEHRMYTAFGGIENAPDSLRKKFLRQAEIIKAAPEMFSWRAIAPYR